VLEGGQRESGESFRAFWLALLALNLGLLAAGLVYADRNGISALLAVPIIAAFLIQASLFLPPGFPRVRSWIENRLPPPRLALFLVLAYPAPYLIYSIPCGVFSWQGFALLLALCVLISFLFVWAPPRSEALCWQDGVVMAALAYPMVSGLGSPFADIYLSPAPEVPPLDILGKLMLAPLGATAFLSLRRLPRTGYRFAISREDFLTGIRNFLWFVPPGAALSIAIGFVRWGPQPVDGWTYPFELAANAVGVYAAVALAEEMYFRGVFQNLLAARIASTRVAILVTSVLFGLSHLGRGWRHALVTVLLGWFCGRAYEQRHSVVASGVTHTLVVLARRYLFL
jgi:membrane protease YdiL (CAAX protease family)